MSINSPEITLKLLRGFLINSCTDENYACNLVHSDHITSTMPYAFAPCYYIELERKETTCDDPNAGSATRAVSKLMGIIYIHSSKMSFAFRTPAVRDISFGASSLEGTYLKHAKSTYNIMSWDSKIF